MTDTRPPPYSMRLDPTLRDKLESAAKAAGRSLHAEIAMRLEASFADPDKLETLTPAQTIEVEKLIRQEVLSPAQIIETKRIAEETFREAAQELMRRIVDSYDSNSDIEIDMSKELDANIRKLWEGLIAGAKETGGQP